MIIGACVEMVRAFDAWAIAMLTGVATFVCGFYFGRFQR